MAYATSTQGVQKKGAPEYVTEYVTSPSHRAAKTVEFLHHKHVQLIEPDLWSPVRPDLNPVDYAVWGALEQKVYQHSIQYLTHLKEIILAEWGKVSMRFETCSINEWHYWLGRV